MDRSSRIFRSLALVATLCLGALGSCVGPDLEPPISRGADKPATPGTPTVGSAGTFGSSGGSGALVSGAAGSKGAEGAASTPDAGGIPAPSAGRGGSPATDADADAGVEP